MSWTTEKISTTIDTYFKQYKTSMYSPGSSTSYPIFYTLPEDNKVLSGTHRTENNKDKKKDVNPKQDKGFLKLYGGYKIVFQ